MKPEKFTPGPWRHSEYWVWRENGDFGQIAYIAYGNRKENVLTEEQIANGKLIEAAPDLYDAAKDALDLLDRRLGAWDGSLYTSEIAKLKAALNKANPQ